MKTIFSRLLHLENDSIFVFSVKEAIQQGRSFNAIKMIIDQCRDNRPMVEEMIGAVLLKQIEDFVAEIREVSE